MSGQERSPLLSSTTPSSPGETDRHTEQHTDDATDFRSIAMAVGPMAIGTFFASMDQTIVLASYATIGDELKELQSTSWVSTAYMLSLASFQPLYGKLSDIFGRKPCLLAAYVIFALGCFACGAARSMPELICARILAGIGGGGMSTLVSIVMSDIIPLRSRGTWQGYINIVWASGSAIGAPFGGLLVDTIGWRWLFTAQAPLIMIAFTAVALFLRVPPPSPLPWREKARRIDFVGSICLVTSLASLLTALDRGSNIDWIDPLTIFALCVFVFFTVAFALVEARFAREPVAPIRLLTNSSFLGPYVCNLASLGCSVTTVFYVSLYIQAIQGRSAAQAGTALLPSIVASVIGSLLGGKVIQRWGRFRRFTMSLYGVMICGSTAIMLSTAMATHSYLGLELGLAMMSIGNGCGLTTTLVSLIGQAGNEQAIVTAVSYLFRSLGAVLCLSLGSTIFQSMLRWQLYQSLHRSDVDEIVRRVRETLTYIDQLDPSTRTIVREAYAQSLQVTFAFCMLLATIAFLSTFWLKEKRIA